MEYKAFVRGLLSNRQLTINQQLNSIKHSVNPGQFKEAIKFHPPFNKFLLKDSFFKSLSDIRLKDALGFTRDFKREFKWIANIIEPHLTDIHRFMLRKNEFDTNIILGNYEQSKQVLFEIESEFGITLWSIESNLLIEESLHGTDANWNKLSYYLKETKNLVYEFVINAGSKRVESKLSYESFQNQFRNDIDNANLIGFLKDFLVFRNFASTKYDYEFPDLSSVLYVTNVFAVIDQYLIVIDVVIHNITNATLYDKTLLPFVTKAKDIVKSDFRLTNIFNTISQEKYQKNEDSEMILECLNNYYSGDFNCSLKISKTLLKLFPLEYELYEIYCKSLINLNLDFQPLEISFPADDLLKHTFLVLSFKKEHDECHKILFKYSLIFLSCQLGKQIWGLISDIVGDTERNYSIGLLSSRFASPKSITLCHGRENALSHYNEISFTQHCFKVFKFRDGHSVDFNQGISNSDPQAAIIRAIHLIKIHRNDEVIELLSSFENDAPLFFQERRVSYLFQALLAESKIKDALILFGDVFFDDIIVVRKLNYHELFHRIKSGSDNSLVGLIERPVLYSLLVKEYDLYEPYDDFLNAIGVDHIREMPIKDFISTYGRERTIYFLSKIATIDTLKYSTDYGSINEVEEDRIYILNELKTLDPGNNLIFEREIDEIYRANSVRKVLKEVDEGRLFIDVNNLREVQIKKFKNDFNRYKEIEVLSTSQSLIGFNSNSKNWETALADKYTADEDFNRADYIAFKNIYLESRENFLFSKEYGLDSSLSTRIRHGALKNHIRSVFEKLNLVTSKINERYRENEVWRMQLHYYPELNLAVQEKLKTFSKRIDDYNIFIVDKLIQIQTEKTLDKKEGLFQYFTNDELLNTFYREGKFQGYLNSIESTVDIILTNLVNYTLLGVQETIFTAFTTTIPAYFQTLIENLIHDLRSLELPNGYQLIQNLSKSSTDISQELDYLSNWFYLNTTSSASLLSMRTILDASLNLTNRINPTFSLSPEIIIRTEFASYSNLIFVFNILFKNVIEHCKLPTEELKLIIEIDADQKHKKAWITFRNNLNSNFDFTANICKLQAVKENWNNHDNIDRSNKEGESGYDKIKRILLYEALAKTEFFEFEFKDNTISVTLFFPYNKSTQ